MFGNLERCGNSCKILNFPFPCLRIQSFHITFLTFLQRSTNENLQEIILTNNVCSHFANIIIRADKCSNRNDTTIQKQLRHFRYATDIFHPVRFGESQVIINSTTDIIPIQDTAKQSTLMKFTFQCDGNRALSGTTQSGKPDHHTVLPQKLFFVLPRHHAVKYRIYMVLFFHLQFYLKVPDQRNQNNRD